MELLSNSCWPDQELQLLVCEFTRLTGPEIGVPPSQQGAQVLVHILFKLWFLCGDENEEATAVLAPYILITLIDSKTYWKLSK